MREKWHWEKRIRELGGPDYKVCIGANSALHVCVGSNVSIVRQRTGPKMLDHEGKEVPGNSGYKYFGAARDLPGVRFSTPFTSSDDDLTKTRTF